MYASPTFHFSKAGVLVDSRRILNIHIQERLVILSTVLMICIVYGTPDIDPVHVVVLMELDVESYKSAVVQYLEGTDCGLSPTRRIILFNNDHRP